MRQESNNYPHALLGPFKRNPLENYSSEHNLPHLELFLAESERFYQVFTWLSSERSKKSYIELLLYRMLGFPHVKLSTNTPTFHQSFQKTARYPSRATDSQKRNLRGQRLRTFLFPYQEKNWQYLLRLAGMDTFEKWKKWV